MAMQSLVVGLGTLSLVDTSVTPPVPRPVAALTDIQVDVSWTVKDFEADKQMAIASARVGQKITLKAKTGDVNGSLLAQILNATAATGTTKVTTASAAASTTVTPTVPGSGTWSEDLGVRNASGLLMTPVASSPAQDVSYTISAGTYGFHASQSGTMSIRYAYTVTGGHKIQMTNQAIGATPFFEAVLYNDYTQADGSVSQIGYRFYSVTCAKLAMASKRDNFTEIDLDMQVYPRATDGEIGYTYTA
jgi:hypothetical protein